MKRILLFLIFITISLTSYSRDLENNYSEQRKIDIINYEWWNNFGDPFLNNYILYGIENSNDLKIIESKLREYNEFTKYTFGSELPTVSTSLIYANMKDVPLNNTQTNIDGLMLPLTVNYELDLFGKNRNKTKSTKKQLEAYAFQKDASYISYVSNLGTIYFNIIKFNKILDLTNELIKIKKNLLNNAYAKFKSKLISEDQLNSYREDLKTTENKKIEILKNKNILLTQLAVLVGDNPVNVDKYKFMDLYDIKMNFNEKQEFSSDLIFNRPDVLSQEKILEKSKIDIKVARREFLPTLNISGGLIFNDIVGGGFFNVSNTIKNLIAGCTQSLFVGGKKKANLKMMNEKYIQMLENYKKVSLQAVKEIMDSLQNMIFNFEINIKDEEKYSMEVKSFRTNQIKYKNNLISESELLLLKQKVIQKELDLVSSRTELFINYISLYKSVGGKI